MLSIFLVHFLSTLILLAPLASAPPPRAGLKASHVEHLQKVVVEVCHHDERKRVIQQVSSLVPESRTVE